MNAEDKRNENGFGDYEGTIVAVEPEKVTASGFRLRSIVIDGSDPAQSKWANPVKFTFKKDKCDLVKPFEQAVGRRVRIRFVINGRKWDGPNGVQYFVDLTGLKLTDLVPANVPSPAAPAADEDNLPF